MRMRLVLLLACFCLLDVSSAFAKRDKIECSKVSLTKLQPGWGRLPAALQKLPPGATLCGSAGDTAFITSELDAEALRSFYTPLFAKLGCKLTCKKKEFRGEVCECPTKSFGSTQIDTGYIQLQPFDQAYQLFFATD